MSSHEIIQQTKECNFDRVENQCYSELQSLTNLNHTNDNLSDIFNSFELDNLLLRQLYNRNYLSCSFNYSSLSSTLIVRSHLFNHFGLVISIIFVALIILLIFVIALLNNLQYKIEEYDEVETRRQSISWTTLRRTISQTSLRRSRKDLRTLNIYGISSKSDNQLDRLK